MINIPIKETYSTIKQFGSDTISVGKQSLQAITGLTSKRQKGRKSRVKIMRVGRNMFTELKYKDFSYFTQYANTTGIFVLLNGIGAGTGPDQRIGRKTQIRSIHVNLQCYSPANFYADTIRMMLVRDRQPNGEIFTASDLLENTTYPVISPRSMDSKERFVIYKTLLPT